MIPLRNKYLLMFHTLMYSDLLLIPIMKYSLIRDNNQKKTVFCSSPVFMLNHSERIISRSLKTEKFMDKQKSTSWIIITQPQIYVVQNQNQLYSPRCCQKQEVWLWFQAASYETKSRNKFDGGTCTFIYLERKEQKQVMIIQICVSSFRLQGTNSRPGGPIWSIITIYMAV